MVNQPSQIGRYRILGQLGRGGMGTVYLGQDEAGDRVAVKVINPEYSQNEEFRIRFRREAQAAQRVRRFCTAAVLDSDLAGGQLYVVTEYVDGLSLEQAVNTNGPLRGSSLDALAVGVATALTAIHGAGIVHRDLKPSNVLLSHVGPRVIDFGIARAMDTFGGVTHTGELIGTPRYMAPEILRGEPTSPACDVFSWGCLVAFAATGRTPFGGDALPAVIYQVLNAEPVLDHLEPGLRELVTAALVKDPARRPTSQQLLDHMVGRVTPEHAQSSVAQAWQQGGDAPAPTRAVTQSVTQLGTQSGPQFGTQSGTRIGAGSTRRTKALAGVGMAAVLVLAAAGVTAKALLGSSGPPEDLPVLYQMDFTTGGDWSGTYAEGTTSKYGWHTSGFYAIDLDKDNDFQGAAAPIPFVATPPTPDPTVTTSPTPVTPSALVIGVDVWTRSVTGRGEYGLYCRGNGSPYDPQRYEFLLDTTGQAWIRRVSKGSGGAMAKPVKVNGLPAEKDARTTLTVSCEASGKTMKLKMWVNEDLVQEVTDPDALPPGDIGLLGRVTADGKDTVKLGFDDFVMKGMAPENSGTTR